jgi:hypothetical protein
MRIDLERVISNEITMMQITEKMRKECATILATYSLQEGRGFDLVRCIIFHFHLSPITYENRANIM